MKVVQKDKITDKIIAGIKNNDNTTIVMVYDKYFSSIRKMVSQFRRLNLDADDVFQEGLTRAVVNIQNDKFMGKSSFHSYLYAICKNICLKDYNKGKHEYNRPPEQDVVDEAAHDEWQIIELVLELRERLDAKCREILDLRFNLNRSNQEDYKLQPFEYIASVLQLKPDNARQRFKR